MRYLCRAPRHPPHLHAFPTRRSSDLKARRVREPGAGGFESAAIDIAVPEAVQSAEDESEDRLVQTVHIVRSEEHTSELQSPCNLVCRLLLEKKQEPTPGRKICTD